MPNTIIAQCVQGRYEAKIGNEYAEIKPGEFFLVNPFVEVAITHRHRRGRMASRWIHCCYSYRNYLDVFQFCTLPLHLKGAKARVMSALLDQVQAAVESGAGGKVGREERSGEAGAQMFSRMQAYKLSGVLLEALGSLVKPDAGSILQVSDRLQPVFEYVQRHCDRELSVEELAACVHLSPPRFYALFKEMTHMTPKAFADHARIDRACRLLCRDKVTVGEVAERLGFSSPFNFSRAFKRIRKVSPKAYQLANRDSKV